jgi:uncharacterized protein YjbI with pentapeptide repeats
MTRRWIQMAVLILCMLTGWAFGFIRLPYIDEQYAFWIGFAGCAGLLVLVSALVRIWNHHSLIRYFEPQQYNSTGVPPQKAGKTGILLSLLFFGLLGMCVYAYQHLQHAKAKLQLVRSELDALRHDDNLEQQKNKITLLMVLIHRLDSVRLNSADTASVALMMNRIAELSSSLKVHKVWDMENKLYRTLSTERGLLLLALVKTQMDSVSFKRIKENVSFFGADLCNADFSGLDLSGIDLRNANLDYADLQGINLNYARLNGASLVGANLNHATMIGVNLTGARLNWAKVNEANLQFSKIDSADLSNVTACKSRFDDGTIIHTLLCNAIFIEADLRNCLLISTNLENVNFAKSILTNADFYDMNLDDPILDAAIIQDHWLERFKERNDRGLNLMLEHYDIDTDTTSILDSIIYRLKSKTQ